MMNCTDKKYIEKKLLSIFNDNCYDFKKLEDLSSLDKIELLIEIEEEFEIEIDETDYGFFNFKNINDLIFFIERKINEHKEYCK